MPCACGCGELIPKYDKKGRERRFISGHYRRGITLSGEDNPNRINFIKEKEEEIIKIYKEGLKTIVEISKIMGVGLKPINRVLKENNVEKIHRKNESLRIRNLTDNPAKRPEVKEKMKKINHGTFIERFGEERAKIICEKLREKLSGINHPTKNKTYEEIYGIEKANELKDLRRKSISKNIHCEWTDKRRAENSNRVLKLWQDKEYRERTLKNMLKNRYNKPTSFERKISDLCIKYNLPFMYCGNGNFFVGTKNPDFIHKTKPIAIEVFSNFFKISVFGSVENYINERTAYFHEYGYEVIFIGEEEVLSKDWENICLNKIMGTMKNEKT